MNIQRKALGIGVDTDQRDGPRGRGIDEISA